MFLLINSSGSKEPFSFPGATWDRFRCTVQPSPGHIRCRNIRSHRAKNLKNRLEVSKRIVDTFRHISRGTDFPTPFKGRQRALNVFFFKVFIQDREQNRYSLPDALRQLNYGSQLQLELMLRLQHHPDVDFPESPLPHVFQILLSIV